MAGPPPNILWIMTDHQRTDSLGCYGSPWAVSPNFDRLAAAGVRFANCTTQAPICVASRTAQLTGRYPHACGVLENQFMPLPNEYPLTWYFRDRGYQVVNFGLCHYSDQKRGPFAWHEGGPGPGARGATLESLADGYDAAEHCLITIPVRSAQFDKLIVGGRFPLPKAENEPELLAKRCQRFLKRQANPPFLLRVSISAPHTPVLPASDYYGLTDPSKIDIPLPSETIGAAIPRYEAEVIRSHQGYMQLTEEQVLQARGNFYDLCAEIDEAIGTIVDCVSSCGYGDDTIIAFNSDHGTLLGEYGLAQNRTLFDPVVQVPLIISGPGRLPEGLVITDPVELIDFFPTLMALARIEIPGNVHGRNLLPQIEGEIDLPDRPVFSEIDYTCAIPEAVRRFGSHRAMVRHRGWKLFYSLYDGGFGPDGALFDLGNDPHELNNQYGDLDNRELVGDLKHTVEQWQAML